MILSYTINERPRRVVVQNTRKNTGMREEHEGPEENPKLEDVDDDEIHPSGSDITSIHAVSPHSRINSPGYLSPHLHPSPLPSSPLSLTNKTTVYTRSPLSSSPPSAPILNRSLDAFVCGALLASATVSRCVPNFEECKTQDHVKHEQLSGCCGGGGLSSSPNDVTSMIQCWGMGDGGIGRGRMEFKEDKKGSLKVPVMQGLGTELINEGEGWCGDLELIKGEGFGW